MDKPRGIKAIFTARKVTEGAGVNLKRVFGNVEAYLTDPFLLLDDFHSEKKEDYIKGFPWHPHRGIETITYVLHGYVDHGDSLGNSGTISGSEVQWMTAGSGIIHQEMPRGEANNLLWGFQLWANLPSSGKMCDPAYREVKKGEIPEVITDSGASVRIICGDVNGVKGPVSGIAIQPEYLDVTMKAGSCFTRPVRKGFTAFAYVIAGELSAEDNAETEKDIPAGTGYYTNSRKGTTGKEQLILFSDGDYVSLRSGPDGARFLLVSGKPLREPVAWYGPIVMNTDEEIRTAVRQLREGTFIKNSAMRH